MLGEALDKKLCLKQCQIKSVAGRGVRQNAMLGGALDKKLCLKQCQIKSVAGRGVRQKALLREE